MTFVAHVTFSEEFQSICKQNFKDADKALSEIRIGMEETLENEGGGVVSNVYITVEQPAMADLFKEWFNGE